MIDQRVSVLKDQYDRVNRELELARQYPQMHPYRDPAHVQGLRDELAAVNADLEILYQGIQADQLAKANIRQAGPAEREAIDRAQVALEKATAEAEASIREHAVKVREAARAVFEAQAAGGQNTRYHIIWGVARNRLVNAARQAFEH